MTEAYKTKNRETTHKRKKTKKGYGKKYCLGLSTLFVCYLVFFVSNVLNIQPAAMLGF